MDDFTWYLTGLIVFTLLLGTYLWEWCFGRKSEPTWGDGCKKCRCKKCSRTVYCPYCDEKGGE